MFVLSGLQHGLRLVVWLHDADVALSVTLQYYLYLQFGERNGRGSTVIAKVTLKWRDGRIKTATSHPLPLSLRPGLSQKPPGPLGRGGGRPPNPRTDVLEKSLPCAGSLLFLV